MKVAITGIRGIPACYGGFETFAEELGSRLVKMGHDVRVYGRTHFIKHNLPTYRGCQIKLIRSPQYKYFETPIHTLLCLCDLLFDPVDCVLVCNAANSPFIWIPRLRGIPVALNLDGIERKRAKWNILGKIWYRIGEICSVLFADKCIADAAVIRQYYEEMYHCSPSLITYGYKKCEPEIVKAKISGTSDLESLLDADIFRAFNLRVGEYLLYVARLEPENNAHIVIDAYNKVSKELNCPPLVIVGDAPYAKEYISTLKKQANSNVIWTGYRFGEDYCKLQQGAYLYIQAGEVGGTHPALVEAMGYANCIIANDTPEHREVLSKSGLFYAKNDASDLAQKIKLLIENKGYISQYRELAYVRAQEHYNWDKIALQYEELFFHLI